MNKQSKSFSTKMKNLSIFFIVNIALMLFGSCSNEATIQQETEVVNELRIVSLHAAASEIICALGAQDQLVGVDVTSVYPVVLEEKANLGHISGITAQGILSLKPDMVIVNSVEFSEQLEAQLKEVGVEIHKISPDYSVNGSLALIKQIGVIVQLEEKAQELINDVKKEFESIQLTDVPKSVVFVYARGAGTLMVAGKNTQMNALIELAGAQNAFADFDGFKPLTTESLVSVNPDILFLFESGVQSMGGIEGLSQIPGFELTNAGKNGHVITMDGSLVSSFGPRLPQAIKELSEKINNLK
jgi:iron complex transport system substrate-binding protein